MRKMFKSQFAGYLMGYSHKYKYKWLSPSSWTEILLVLALVLGQCWSTQPNCQWSIIQNDYERLNCFVETPSSNNNLIVEEEVYGVGPEHAKSLWVECGGSKTHQQEYLSTVQSSGFVLSHGVFMAVPNLRDLRLDNCRIAGITPGALSYLPYLRNLTIRTSTSLRSWTPASALDIKDGVFQGLQELRHLDMSTTSLTTLPNDFLCFLPSLTHLNLTACWLRDLRSIGISPLDPTNPPNCANHIKVLDLSSNHFTLLPPASFSMVNKVEELRIDSNSITLAAERALLGLTELRIISLAGNQLTSLPPEFFKDNKHLKEIYLQNNSLAVLAPGLFSGLEHLVALDLSNNELSSEWVNGETFSGLVRLILLNLANNELTKIDSILFKDLYSLQVLNLESNRLHHISEDAFAGMYNLHTLLLSHNRLKQIDSYICNGLQVLSFLALDSNKIESCGSESFQNCSALQDLNLSGNKLTEIPQALSTLIQLRTLDLGENLITSILNASYASLPNLYGLRLTDNQIKSIHSDAFGQLPSLKIVNLAKNNITTVEPGAFDHNDNLQAVRLDSNRIKDITGLFKNIPNLLWLNISANSLEELQYQNFPPKLQWLDLRSNNIATLGSCLDLSENLRIRNLDLSNNYIGEISAANLPDSIEVLVLNNNRIHTIQPYTFFRKPNLTRVDLSSNQLIKLDQNSLRLSPRTPSSSSGSTGSSGQQPQIPEILLGHNPLHCDCSMEWLQKMNSLEGVGSYPYILDASDVKCTLAFDRMYEPVPFMTIPSNQFLCKYESHCFSLCHCCDFDACDCQMTCPKNCSCYHDLSWSTNLVDCSMLETQSQTIIPGRIPMDVTQLYLDGNIIPSLDSHAFIGRKNLKSLFLNASHIEIIQNRSFHGLKNLQILHLQNNFLERFDGYEFEDLDSLEELYLHQNSLSYISNDTFRHLSKLHVLWLHNNNFIDLPIWSSVNGLMVRHSLSELTLRGNEWSCDCHFSQIMRDWLRLNRVKIIDAGQVHCVDQISTIGENKTAKNELLVLRLLDQRNVKCSPGSYIHQSSISGENSEILESEGSHETGLSIVEPNSTSSDNFNYLPLLLSLSALCLVLVLLSGVSYYWRKALKVWIYAKFGWRITLAGASTCSEGSSIERDKLFDAFISYSSKDEAWVRQVLASELERNDPPYRLCLRYRDLPTGGTYLADTIVQASEASKRTILVLSHHFLKGEWGRSDVKSAHHSVLKDRHRKVIIILLGDLPSKDLDPDIRLYLKNHTYLNCDDRKFWDKLRYKMPDVKIKDPLIRGAVHSRSNSTHHHHHYQSPQQQQQQLVANQQQQQQIQIQQQQQQQHLQQRNNSLNSLPRTVNPHQAHGGYAHAHAQRHYQTPNNLVNNVNNIVNNSNNNGTNRHVAIHI